MIILSIAFQILCLSGALFLFFFTLHKVKGLFITGTYALSREVEMGEHCQGSFNSYAWDSKEKVLARYQAMIAPIEARKAFCHDRFQNILAVAKETQEGA